MLNFKRDGGQFLNVFCPDNAVQTDLRAMLKKECGEQKVFLAIRHQRVDFYHQGGGLFGYGANGFETHHKYATVLDSGSEYVSEIQLQNRQLNTDFYEGYSSIKKNCQLYAGIEAQGVAQLYHQFSYLSSHDIVVLDIEISFNHGADRIDLLLFNKTSQELKFVEAKHYSNKDLWSKAINPLLETDADGNAVNWKQPKVLGQLERYQQILSKEEDCAVILEAYTQYIAGLNKIFNLVGKQALPIPQSICKQVTLFIFGFDNDQKQGRLAQLKSYFDNSQVLGQKPVMYAKGDVKTTNLSSLWSAK